MELELELELGGLSHLFVSFFLYNLASILVLPAITDVTMAAICPGENECSLAIYLSGLQQAIVGVGMAVMVPLIGKLSDLYGRKTLLTIPFILSIIPLDNISEEKRISAFGVLSGIGAAAFILGTLAARLLSGAQAFRVIFLCHTFLLDEKWKYAVAVAALIYMRVFLKDTRCHHDASSVQPNDALVHPILQSGSDIIQSDDESSKKIQIFKRIPSPGACSRVVFQFNKNQFADIILIMSIAATISQLLLMPTLAPIVGDEEKLLSTGLFVGSLAVYACTTRELVVF
ncbi:unnamed protein product [Ilex paraguariensis]|uniref:Major facilitator superfamily (MFS) profile domain-containing protein n=1 Tax=Ilex paraguariensis TaxID=185542 RepID=A0ABC8SAH2_9AQUA